MLLPTPRYLPDPEMETVSLALTSPALTGGFFTTRATWGARVCVCVCVCVHTPCTLALWLPCPSGRVGDPTFPPRSTDGGD